MPSNLAVFFLCLLLSVWAGADEPPRNPDKGEILLGGVVLAPGDGGDNGLPGGMIPLSGASVTIEGTKHATTTDGRGLFIFTESPEGEVTVVISKDGYQTLKRKATVEKGAGEPAQMTVEMLPVGATASGGLTGPGTLYATFVPRTENQAGEAGDFTNLLAILALGVDPQSVATERPPGNPLDPKAAMEMFPTSDAPSCIMIRPANAPSRTTFHEMGSVPIWPCFDKAGRYLYVSTVYQHRIEVIDVTKGNEYVANIPLEAKAFVTSLTLSKDGRYLFATQMGSRMGVRVIDTASHLPVAFLDLPDAMMIPNAAALSPDGTRLYLTLTNAATPGAAGQLMAMDPSTGAVLSSVAVGGTPTDVLITPDGKTAITVNLGNGNLSVVDLQKGVVVRTVPAEVSPNKAVLTLDGTKVLVTNRGSNTVSVLNLADGRILGRVKVGSGPMDIVLSKDGLEAYVSNYKDGTISIIDVNAATVKATTPPNPRSNPLGLTIRP